jgi:hypothetical protein
MFNPTNIDKVSVQATHLEAIKGKHVIEDNNPYKFENKSKGKWKSKKLAIVKQVEEMIQMDIGGHPPIPTGSSCPFFFSTSFCIAL